MREIWTRIASGLVYIGLMVFGILYHPLAGQILFGIIVFFGTAEYGRLIKASKQETLFLQLAALGVYILALLFSDTLATTLVVSLLCVLVAIFVLLSIFKESEPFSSFAKRIFGVLVLSLPFVLMAQRLDTTPYLILGLFILLWVNDTLAYITGRLFGRHKLFERLSPKKSWEGFFGGMIFTMTMAYYLADKTGMIDTNHALVIALVLSITAPLGDLFESGMKRKAGVKDSGNIMPGHGGILDRFDGLILCVPLIHLIMTYGLKYLF